MQISNFLENYNLFVIDLLEKLKTLLSIFGVPKTAYELSHKKSS